MGGDWEAVDGQSELQPVRESVLAWQCEGDDRVIALHVRQGQSRNASLATKQGPVYFADHVTFGKPVWRAEALAALTAALAQPWRASAVFFLSDDPRPGPALPFVWQPARSGA